MQDFLDLKFWNNTLLNYLIFLGSLAASLVVILILKRVILRRLLLRASAAPSGDTFAHALKKYLLPLVYIGALYLNTKWLTLSKTVQKGVDVAVLAIVMILGAMLASSVLIYLFNKYLEKKKNSAGKFAAHWIGIFIKAVVWICAFLLFLDNLGIEITTLVAGLGIGGIAVAFAAQAILEDVFSFVTIFFDRPFEIGDLIIVDTLMGTVEHIGIKTTRVRSLSGEQLIFSNKDLTSSRLRNYKRMENRRVVFSLGVMYTTPMEKLKMIPALMQDIIGNVAQARFDRAHFKAFAECSLDFEIVYYVLSQDYRVYMDVQQDINFAVKESFDANGIEFAFPTQTLYVQRQSG